MRRGYAGIEDRYVQPLTLHPQHCNVLSRLKYPIIIETRLPRLRELFMVNLPIDYKIP